MTEYGIYKILKERGTPLSRVEMNFYISLKCRISESCEKQRFYHQCIEKDEFPRSFKRICRTSSTLATKKMMKGIAKNKIETENLLLDYLEGPLARMERRIDVLEENELAAFKTAVNNTVINSTIRVTNKLYKDMEKKQFWFVSREFRPSNL